MTDASVIVRAAFATLLVACGSTTPTPTTVGAAPPDPPPTPAPVGKGTTGVGTLDWGASEEAVRAAFPKVTAKPDGGLWETGTTDGLASRTSFGFDAKGLAQIGIEWSQVYPDMGACMTTWRTLRVQYDAKFGPSQSDNGAAYWTTPTAQIELACNPRESGESLLYGLFTPPEAE